MHKPSTIKDYLIALFIALVTVSLFLLYLEARRGYVNLYITNKVFAATAAVMLGIVFLIGPLCRHFQKLDFAIQYRKEIGIVAGIFATVHGIISLFFLPSRFPLKSYLSHLDTFIPGLVGVLVLGYLIWISRQSVIVRIGASTWWKLQRWGIRIAVLATLVHVIWMKFPGWKSWIVKGGSPDLALPSLPPASILALMFLSWVALVRLYEYFALYPSHHVSVHHMPPVLSESANTTVVKGVRWFIIGSGVLLLTFYVFSFWYGSRW